MNSKTIAIAAVLAATLVAGVFATTPMAAYAGGDSSETNTEQSIKQKNVGGDGSTNFNCADNSISGATDGETDVDAQICGTVDVSALDGILG